MPVNLVHWNLLLSKKAIFPTLSGQTRHFLGEKPKTRLYNLHHRKAWSVLVILSLRVGFQSGEAYWWSVCYHRGLPRLVFSTRWQ